MKTVYGARSRNIEESTIEESRSLQVGSDPSGEALDEEEEEDVKKPFKFCPYCHCELSSRCFCKACCCLLTVYIVVGIILKFFVYIPLLWPGGDSLDWQYCSEYHFIGGDGSQLSACRGILTPRAGTRAYSAYPNSSEALTTLIVFGGNAQTQTDSARLVGSVLGPQYRNFILFRMKFEVFSSSYRGFKPNDDAGSPREDITAQDAEKLLDFVLTTPNAQRSGGKVLVVGYSMGAAVCLSLVARRPESVAGVLLICPFSGVWEIAVHYFFPLGLWVWWNDRWNNLERAAAIPANVPVAVMSAQEDKVVPASMHREVFDSLHANRKYWLPSDGVGHVDIDKMASHQVDGIGQWLKSSCSNLLGGC